MSKNGDFLIFSFYAKWIGKVFFELSERKKAFLDHNNIGFKNDQNLHFFKGVFVKNWKCFYSLVFMQNGSIKSVL